MPNVISSIKLGKILGFENKSHAHIKDKILRDAKNSKGNNKLSPYKNRASRWSRPVIILNDEKPPKGWKDAKLIIKGRWSGCRFTTKYKGGFGYYIKNVDWQNALTLLKKRGFNTKTKVGRFKIGIPFEEAATEENCKLVATTLAYQAHRILGKNDMEIRKAYPDLYKVTKKYKTVKKPICPFCKNILRSKGFLGSTDDTTDSFHKRREAKDDVIQMFHIKCLKPGNVSWGHRRCNVAVGQHDLPEAEKWFKEVLINRGCLKK